MLRSQPRQLIVELSKRIRSGELDDRMGELAPRLEEHVRRKLAIARPGYGGGGPEGQRNSPEARG